MGRIRRESGNAGLSRRRSTRVRFAVIRTLPAAAGVSPTGGVSLISVRILGPTRAVGPAAGGKEPSSISSRSVCHAVSDGAQDQLLLRVPRPSVPAAACDYRRVGLLPRGGRRGGRRALVTGGCTAGRAGGGRVLAGRARALL